MARSPTIRHLPHSLEAEAARERLARLRRQADARGAPDEGSAAGRWHNVICSALIALALTAGAIVAGWPQ